jgi:phospholipid transport system substrate-binding protein
MIKTIQKAKVTSVVERKFATSRTPLQAAHLGARVAVMLSHHIRPTILRRRALRALAIVCLSVALLPAMPDGVRAASTSNGAGDFLAAMTDRAIAQLTDETLDQPEREARFRELFRETFDVPAVGRFVLGRYWRRAKPDVRETFLSIFEEIMVQRFAPRFAGYAEAKFEISGVKALQGEGQYVVISKVSADRGEPVQVNWRIRERDGQFKILDVIGEGVSMAITLRSEYTSAIKDAGGQVEGLIARLRKQIQLQADTQTTNNTGD